MLILRSGWLLGGAECVPPRQAPPMLQLAASLGFKQVPHPSGTPGLVRMVLELGN